MKKVGIHRILAIIVFLVVAFNEYTHIFFEGGDLGELLWFCDVMSFVLAVGLWFKNRFIITTVFLASVPAQFLWIVDYFLNLLGSGFGRTAWMFTDSYVWWTPYISTIMHGILIPVSFYSIYKYGFEKYAIFGVYFVIFSILPITFYFTDPTINRNCVFFPCDLNFVDDKNIIQNHAGYYLTYKYLLKEIGSWLFYTTGFYVLFYFVYYKLINKSAND